MSRGAGCRHESSSPERSSGRVVLSSGRYT